MSMEVFLWWEELGGTMGFVLDVQRKVSSSIDLTTMTRARAHTRPAGMTTGDVHIPATILSTPAPTVSTCSMRVVVDNSFPLAAGNYTVWGELSPDGSVWYPTGSTALRVRP